MELLRVESKKHLEVSHPKETDKFFFIFIWLLTRTLWVKDRITKLRKEFEYEKIQLKVQTSETERNKADIKLDEQKKWVSLTIPCSVSIEWNF